MSGVKQVAQSEPGIPTSKNSNIKVVARFRPMMDFERTTQSSSIYAHELKIQFLNQRAVKLQSLKGTDTYTLDKIFDPSTPQQAVYDFIGKPTIQDVLLGYNGTIFAYGQTGSGKTFSMMGSDIFDDQTKGIIPRAVSHIFHAIYQDPEVEFTLKCSMLEIYKENLRDLLDPELGSNMKIKQDPRRGIYVDGLTGICVTSQQEIYELITMGEQIRVVSSHKMNQNSSRSHLLFMLEVRQKLPNQTEKTGTLNLVDLAGSEKISQTGVSGQALEEAKKINLSLSALGNVIHALTVKSEHIPYRDSKLTRLLQESLGGNFKTTLIVACTPAPRCIQETLNTLKFANRAKTIKNKVKQNLKATPEHLMRVIERLKKELKEARQEIAGLKSGGFLVPEIPAPSPVKRQKVSRQKQTRSSAASALEFSGQTTIRSTVLKQEKDALAVTNQKLADQMQKLQRTVQSLKKENKKLSERNQTVEQKMAKLRTKQLQAEQKTHQYYECYHKTLLLINKDSQQNKLIKHQNQSMNRQILKLTKSLQQIDDRFKYFIENSQNASTFVQFQSVTQQGITPSQEPSLSQIDKLDTSEILNLKLKTSHIPIESNAVINSSPYTQTFKSAIEANLTLNHQITIFQLKNQIVEAGVINVDMSRELKALQWKYNVMKQKYQTKRAVCKHQLQQMKALEDMIEYLHHSYTYLFNLIERIDGDGTQRQNFPQQKVNPKLMKVVPRKADLKKTPLNFSRDSILLSHSNLMQSHLAIDPDLNESHLTVRYKNLETSLNLQQLYNHHLKMLSEQNKTLAGQYKKLLNSLQIDMFKNKKQESEKFNSLYSQLKENCERELMKKQGDLVKVNENLNQWIQYYNELQQVLRDADKPLPHAYYKQLQNAIRHTLNTLNQVKQVSKMQSLIIQPSPQKMFGGRPSNSPTESAGGDTEPLYD